MRELVYDIIENGKVIETTPILSKAKASGNYPKVVGTRRAGLKLNLRGAPTFDWARFLIISHKSHICQEQNCTKIMPAPARNLCLTAKELYDII